MSGVGFLDEETRGFGEDGERGDDQEGGGDDLHGEWDLPLAGGGARDVFVDDVVAPVAEKGGELVVDFVDADEGAADRGGGELGYVLVVLVGKG